MLNFLDTLKSPFWMLSSKIFIEILCWVCDFMRRYALQRSQNADWNHSKPNRHKIEKPQKPRISILKCYFFDFLPANWKRTRISTEKSTGFNPLPTWTRNHHKNQPNYYDLPMKLPTGEQYRSLLLNEFSALFLHKKLSINSSPPFLYAFARKYSIFLIIDDLDEKWRTSPPKSINFSKCSRFLKMSMTLSRFRNF